MIQSHINPEPQVGKRRVLIVDDQQQIHDTFARIFTPRREENQLLEEFENRFLSSEDAESQRGKSAADSRLESYEITHAMSGQEAAEHVRQGLEENSPYAVAFIDMRMPPGWDGLETTERLWHLDSALQIVICTAYSDHRWDDVLNRLGQNDRLLLLKKPFETDEVRQLALALSEKGRLESVQKLKMQELRREIGLRQQVEAELRQMALRDALTSLPNRTFLLQRLSHIFANRDHRSDRRDALLFLDLDNFKIVNDSLGHDAGDDLLNQVAYRLKECVRRNDVAVHCGAPLETTVRLGGDEFVVLLEKLTNTEDAMHVARRIVERLSQPFKLGDRLVTVGTSVGVAFLDDRVRDGNEALRNADTAMYRAKQQGKGRVAIFDQTMHEAICARLELEEQLRQASHDDSFSLRYQPIVDLRQGRICGIEVLMRWKRRAGNEVPPLEFIPIAEEIGLIGTVGEWVFKQATQEIGSLLERLPNADQDVYVGVNVSQRQLGDPYFVERLEEILDDTGFERQRLKLEVRESSDPRQGEQVLTTMLELHDSGIGIQIDDFGKGQSSLTCFQAYPIEAVKVDRTFTASVTCDHSHAVITQTMIQLAHHLSAQLIAEGVESIEQLDVLRSWGCDLAQGYLFAPPLTIDQLQELLADPNRSAGLRHLRKLVHAASLEARPSPIAGTTRR